MPKTKDNIPIPTPRQTALAKELVKQQMEGKAEPLGATMEKVGYSHSSAISKPGELVSNPGVQVALKEEIKTMQDAMRKSGITPLKVAQRINKLLDAKVKTETFKKGELQTTITREDTFAIDKGVTHALKLGLGGGYAQGVDTGNLTINFFNNPQLLQIRNKFEVEIKEALSAQLEPPVEEGDEHNEHES